MWMLRDLDGADDTCLGVTHRMLCGLITSDNWPRSIGVPRRLENFYEHPERHTTLDAVSAHVDASPAVERILDADEGPLQLL